MIMLLQFSSSSSFQWKMAQFLEDLYGFLKNKSDILILTSRNLLILSEKIDHIRQIQCSALDSKVKTQLIRHSLQDFPERSFDTLEALLSVVKELRIEISHPGERPRLDLNVFSGLKGLEVVGVDLDVLGKTQLVSIEKLAVKSSPECMLRLIKPSALSSLIELDLSHNSMEEVSILHHLKGLRTLNLSNNKIKSITGLAHLKVLHCLDISFNQIADEDELSVINEFNQLETLKLKGNPIGPFIEWMHILQKSIDVKGLKVDVDVRTKGEESFVSVRMKRSKRTPTKRIVSLTKEEPPQEHPVILPVVKDDIEKNDIQAEEEIILSSPSEAKELPKQEKTLTKLVVFENWFTSSRIHETAARDAILSDELQSKVDIGFVTLWDGLYMEKASFVLHDGRIWFIKEKDWVYVYMVDPRSVLSVYLGPMHRFILIQTHFDLILLTNPPQNFPQLPEHIPRYPLAIKNIDGSDLIEFVVSDGHGPVILSTSQKHVMISSFEFTVDCRVLSSAIDTQLKTAIQAVDSKSVNEDNVIRVVFGRKTFGSTAHNTMHWVIRGFNEPSRNRILSFIHAR